MPRMPWVLLGRAALALLACAVWSGAAAAQAPPHVGDTVRVQLPLLRLQGVATVVTPDSLIVTHRDPRYRTPASIDASMLQGLKVKVGQRSRFTTVSRSVLVALGINATLVLLAGMTGSDASTGDRLKVLFWPPTLAAGAVVGFSLPAEKWRESRLGHEPSLKPDTLR